MALSLLSKFPMDDIMEWTPLRFAEEIESWDSIEQLLQDGLPFQDLSATKRKLQHSADACRVLADICKEGHVFLLRNALSMSPKLVDTPLSAGGSPLHLAARHGRAAVVRCLVDAGAKLNAPDSAGATPLHQAAFGGDANVVRILLEAGATLDPTDEDGRTPLHYAAACGKKGSRSLRLLIAAGAKVNAQSKARKTPLHEAASAGSAECIRLLLDAAAFVNPQDVNGWRPLHYAARSGAPRAVQSFLDAGVSVEVTTAKGDTPLHVAAAHDKAEVASVLLAAGADKLAVNSSGDTALDRAQQEGKHAIEMLLQNESLEGIIGPAARAHSQAGARSASRPRPTVVLSYADNAVALPPEGVYKKTSTGADQSGASPTGRHVQNKVAVQSRKAEKFSSSSKKSETNISKEFSVNGTTTKSATSSACASSEASVEGERRARSRSRNRKKRNQKNDGRKKNTKIADSAVTTEAVSGPQRTRDAGDSSREVGELQAPHGTLLDDVTHLQEVLSQLRAMQGSKGQRNTRHHR